MAYIRKLDSGLYQATVRLPNGKRTTRTDRLRKVVSDWGRDLESAIARGEWRDPRAGRVTYDEWRDRFMAARVVEAETVKTDASVLRVHLDPQWTGWRLNGISRLEVQGWVRRMHAAGVGAHIIRRAYNLLATMMKDAVIEGVLTDTPCRSIDLPATPTKHPAWFTRAQVDAIVDQLPAVHAAGVELMAWTGLRWGEHAGLKIGDVDWMRRRARVVGTVTQGGRRKDYPKSARSRREVPVPSHVLERLAPLAAGRDAGALLFVTVKLGRPFSASNWRIHWSAALEAAQVDGQPVPRYPPHALRHTAASWLVQDGVPLYDVQKLLGHESITTTMRYAHLAPDAHASIEGSWDRVVTHQRRIGDSTGA